MMTQVIWTRSAWRLCIMSGKARRTILLSIAAMRAPIVVTLKTIHL